MARRTFLPTILMVCTFAVTARAQTFKVIHAFSGSDGAYPYTGMTWDREGNLYGTTSAGGVGCASSQGCGTAFRLSHAGGDWKLTTIYRFRGYMDGWFPISRVVFGPDGNLYGTTYYGGNQGLNGYGFGTVYKLTPPASGDSLASWTHTVIYRFTGGSDGSTPGVGDLIFDAAGNIYGTAEGGGLVRGKCVISAPGCGVVFELLPSSNGWTEQLIYSFTGQLDGDLPIGGVTFDAKGNLLGTASEGGAVGYGTAFELTPSGSGWQETTLHSFTAQADGGYPAASLSLDPDDNTLYGSTGSTLVQSGGGTVFQLKESGDTYAFQTDYLLPKPDDPSAPITENKETLYGTTPDGGPLHKSYGNVFQMTRNAGAWTLKILYDFTANDDGWSPEGNLLVDSSGTLYGTTDLAGKYSQGVVYEITP